MGIKKYKANGKIVVLRPLTEAGDDQQNLPEGTFCKETHKKIFKTVTRVLGKLDPVTNRSLPKINSESSPKHSRQPEPKTI